MLILGGRVNSGNSLSSVASTEVFDLNDLGRNCTPYNDFFGDVSEIATGLTSRDGEALVCPGESCWKYDGQGWRYAGCK